MSTETFEAIRRMLESLGPQDRERVLHEIRQVFPIHDLERQWNVSAEVILDAIARSPDITQRGIRGVLAQAACKATVIETLQGWDDTTPDGNFPYDFRIRRGDQEVTIQVKLQRKVGGQPMHADKAPGLLDPSQYVVETQRTRAGADRSTGESTRPYRFGEFDILAVSMEPCTHDWSQFRFTLGSWLIPRRTDRSLIAIYQPVSLTPNDDWTDRLEQCIDWLNSAVKKTIVGADPSHKGVRRQKKRRSPS